MYEVQAIHVLLKPDLKISSTFRTQVFHYFSGNDHDILCGVNHFNFNGVFLYISLDSICVCVCINVCVKFPSS